MGNTKLRCTQCREYFPTEQAWRSGVMSFCSDVCMIDYQRSPKFSQNKKDTPSELKAEVREADGHRCRFCGDTMSRLHVHHVIYRWEPGGVDSMGNLLTLCWECHDVVHSDKEKYQPLCLYVIELREEHGDKVTLIKELV